MAPSFPPTRASTTSLGCPTPTTRAPARISRASHPTPSALGAVTKVWCQSRSSAARASCSSPSLSLFWCRSTTNSPGTSSPTVPDEASPSCSTKHPTIHQLRSKVSEEHEVIKKKELETGPKASYGYGGKFGTERDRMDKITPRASVAATAWRRTRWTKQLWVLTARARRRSTTLRKIILWALVGSLRSRGIVKTRVPLAGTTGRNFNPMHPKQTIPRGLEAAMGSRRTGWIRVLLALMRWQLPPPHMRKRDQWRQELPAAPAACDHALRTWLS
ncbi:uncharacterized protein [Phaenicophaeus curvirostris]|uniref:uncharacterized protein isoform X6 n=1 Tax=Phaenicophaeus curvirostris TaxID=33595 RepID=UPI0037F09B29